MKLSISTMLLSLGLTALGPVRLMAQDSLHFKIPFDFTAGTKSFAAGEYRVERPAPSVIAIRTIDGRSSTMLMYHGADLSAQPGIATAKFAKYGDRYFLSQVSSNTYGAELVKSRLEKELIARQSTSKPVSVVASSRK